MKRSIIPILLFLFLFSVSARADSKSPSADALQKAAHLLHRATFGPKPGEAEELAKGGDPAIKSWIESQMKPAEINDSKVEEKLKGLRSLSMSTEEMYDTYPRPNKKNKIDSKMMSENTEKPRQMLIELATQKLVRATESKKEFQEVLVDFWFNHFNVDFNKGQVKWFITSYERDAIRPHVFGKFFDLLKATAQHPAMLFYLDNFQSVKPGFVLQTKNEKIAAKAPKGINENYARELMELHTLGVDGGYTQKDVIEVARILTGWSYNPKEGATYKFRAIAHDTGAKRVLGQNFPAGGGEEEGIKLLQFLSRQPATAKHLATKLAQHFISDNPSQASIDELAKVYLATDGDLSSVYRKLFQLPEFWDSKIQRAKIKKPFYFVASAIRTLDGQIKTDSLHEIKKIDSALSQMGEPLYRCQPPTGFKDVAEFWVNPGALVTRINTSLAISQKRIPMISFDLRGIREEMSNAKITDNEGSLKFLNKKLLDGDLKDATMNRIAKELNEEPKVLEEMDSSKKNEKTTTSVNLPQLVGLLLGSPEFQRF